MVASFFAKIFNLANWPREAQLLKNTIDDDEPPPGDVPGEETPHSEQPAPGWQTQVEKGDEPVAH